MQSRCRAASWPRREIELRHEQFVWVRWNQCVRDSGQSARIRGTSSRAKMPVRLGPRDPVEVTLKLPRTSSRVAQTTRDLTDTRGSYTAACVTNSGCVRSLACARDDENYSRNKSGRFSRVRF